MIRKRVKSILDLIHSKIKSVSVAGGSLVVGTETSSETVDLSPVIQSYLSPPISGPELCPDSIFAYDPRGNESPWSVDDYLPAPIWTPGKLTVYPANSIRFNVQTQGYAAYRIEINHKPTSIYYPYIQIDYAGYTNYLYLDNSGFYSGEVYPQYGGGWDITVTFNSEIELHSFSLKKLTSQSEIESFPSLISQVQLSGYTLYFFTPNGTKQTNLEGLSSGGVQSVSYIEDKFAPIPLYNQFTTGSYKFNNYRVENFLFTNASFYIYSSGPGFTSRFEYFGRKVGITYFNGNVGQSVTISLDGVDTVVNYSGSQDFKEIVLDGLKNNSHKVKIYNPIGTAYLSDIRVLSIVPADNIILDRGRLLTTTSGGQIYETDISTLMIVNQKKAIVDVINNTPKVTAKTGSNVVFTTDAEYSPVSGGTFTVSATGKLVGVVVSIYLTPTSTQPIIPATGFKLISGGYVANANLMYMFKVGANDQIQYFITNLDI